MRIYTLIFIIFFTATGCRPTVNIPKPRGYYRTFYPEKVYKDFDSVGFPYSFRYPVYADVEWDSIAGGKHKEPYWINVVFPELGATIYLSYKPINAAEPLDKLVAESYKMSYAHDVRADYIKTSEPFKTKQGYYAMMYAVGGDAASAYQFLITDSVSKFIRGSLYFNRTPNADSLQPSIEFLKKDMDTMLSSLKFK